jgi:hypothetical protein
MSVIGGTEGKYRGVSTSLCSGRDDVFTSSLLTERWGECKRPWNKAERVHRDGWQVHLIEKEPEEGR